LGFSGGLDSTVLLHLLCELQREQGLPLPRPIHINHQLSPVADQWQRHCEALCEELKVPLEIHQVSVEAAGEGPEAAARSARYRVFAQCLSDGDCLLLAHHLDDQVETFFLRLMRGAGTRGLSGIPLRRSLGRGYLWRPLLDYSRAELEFYAREQGLRWIEDESNLDNALDRNYLRHQVLPALEQRWPAYRDRVTRAMETVAEADQLLQSSSEPVLRAACATHFGEPTLDVQALQLKASTGEGPGGASWLLRHWLQQLGLAMPGRDSLMEFLQQILESGADAAPLMQCAGYELRAYRGRIHALPLLQAPAVNIGGWKLAPGEVLDLAGVGRLQMHPATEGGLAVPEGGAWTVHLRQGGERCRPRGRAHNRSLKKLLQESAVPPWWRQRLPLLYGDEGLVAVADLWICEDVEVTPGPLPQRWSLDWNRDSMQLPR
jgi:tRNA(Ile)-lysidine synthase